MRLAAGRQEFFDKLAEGMQTFFVSGTPEHLALSVSKHIGKKLDEDLRSLANALCRLHEPGLENVPLVSWRDSQWSGGTSAAVLDADGHRLREVLERVRGWTSPPRVLIVLFFEDDGAEIPRLVYDPLQQSDLVLDALDILFRQCGKPMSRLARARFENSGFKALEKDFGLFEVTPSLDWRDEGALELFYARLARSWVYAGHPIGSDTIRKWVGQFATSGFADEAHQMLLYLNQHGFVTETTLVEALRQLYQSLVNTSSNRAIPISIQRVGKSEQKLAYRLKPEIPMKSLSEAIEIRKTLPDALVEFYCLDDCVGSGESFEKYLFDPAHNELADELVALLRAKNIKLNILVFHADPRGITALKSHPKAHSSIDVHCVRILDDRHQMFADASVILSNPERRQKFRAFCESIGEKLFPGSALGWEDGQWCIAYDYSVPDNSVPILYKKEPNLSWDPLFPRNR
jgi:hypothetical protein